MPIEELVGSMYKFIAERNDSRLPTYTDNVHAHSRSKGFNNQESGYALQLLKRKNLIRASPRGEWVALKRR